ncbi:Uncharacterised protein [Vibrio cholerae]|uniref:Uncharacterized protein n=1 Tax=Vibrio cholerae TaxID=666 RepID=A0A656A969_VIBCL|nr:Uncharacterised protein [Vibrio cholerae]CSB29383.1 Uncharacterised protein [Vibrio cholerae]CSC97499.1 Uncharacterised protein [Vibrio cholerae]
MANDCCFNMRSSTANFGISVLMSFCCSNAKQSSSKLWFSRELLPRQVVAKEVTIRLRTCCSRLNLNEVSLCVKRTCSN